VTYQRQSSSSVIQYWRKHKKEQTTANDSTKHTCILCEQVKRGIWKVCGL